MEFLRKYATATHIYVPIIKRAVVDFAVGADWTPAAGDVKISIDGAAAGNVTNLPTAIAMGNTAYWDFSLTSGELTGKKVVVTVADAATKAVEDQAFLIVTYGHASAEYLPDLTDGVRMGLTALPNAAAEAAGGLYTRGSGAGQINQQANGQIDANLARWLNVAPNALVAGLVQAGTVLRTGTAQAGAAGTITLDAGASATDGFYNDCQVWIVSATGAAQVRTVLSYVGATKVATITPNWKTNPDNTSVFVILPVGYADVGVWAQAAVNALISGRVDANAQVVGDKTGYSLSQTFPANFSSLVIDANGRVDLSKVLGAAINALIAGRIDANAQVVGDKTGYSLTQTFPANFASLVIDGNGRIDVSKWLGAAVNALVSGRVDASVGALATAVIVAASFAVDAIDASALKTDAGQEIADRILARNIAGGSDAGRTVKEVMAAIRNRVGISGATLTVYGVDDTTPLWTASITTAAGNPLSDVDPA